MSSRYRRRSAGREVLLFATLLGIGAVATVAVLWSLGKVELPFMSSAKAPFARAEARQGPPPGTVAVPVTARHVDAYAQLVRDDLWNPRSRRLAVMYIPKEQAEQNGFILDVRALLGRVLDHDKDAGYAFTEADFMPRGTRPGLVAGIPAGMRALRIPARSVAGLVGLRLGDRFDVVATLAVEPDARAAKQLGGVVAQQLALANAMAPGQKQAHVSVIIQNGMIVSPLSSRDVPTETSHMMHGTHTVDQQVQEIVIAVKPEEVTAFTQAVAVGAALTCVPRSGRPDDPGEDLGHDGSTPGVSGGFDTSGSGNLRVIETIGGSQRGVQAVPDATGSED
jgi:Flp pilus assembly protein CpaB